MSARTRRLLAVQTIDKLMRLLGRSIRLIPNACRSSGSLEAGEEATSRPHVAFLTALMPLPPPVSTLPLQGVSSVRKSVTGHRPASIAPAQRSATEHLSVSW